jgi:hypothetical protein
MKHYLKKTVGGKNVIVEHIGERKVDPTGGKFAFKTVYAADSIELDLPYPCTFYTWDAEGIKLDEGSVGYLSTRMTELSQDFAQESAGEIVPDIDAKRAEFRRLHGKLRVLNGKQPRATEEDF